MDNSKPRPTNDHLGVNKLGKNIRKSPLHQPNFTSSPARQQPQPQVYNISKNDFRSVVQQLTGSPSREAFPRPPHNPPKPQSTRLQRIRPAPLTNINRPPASSQYPARVPTMAASQVPGMPLHAPGMAQPPGPNFIQSHPPGVAQSHVQSMASPHAPYNNSYQRPALYGQSSASMMQPMGHGEAAWGNTAESPISAYMRYLQSSLGDPSPLPNQLQPPQSQYPGQGQAPPPSSGLPSNPSMPALPSPRMPGTAPPPPRLRQPISGPPPPPAAAMTNFPSPHLNGPNPPMPNNTPFQQMNVPPHPFPSPTSQFLLPSPTSYMSLLSPRSPYPVLSPGVHFPPPSPNFFFSPFGQSGILGPGPQPPPSPGLVFPLSPSGFFPHLSPRWRDQ